MGIAFQAGRGKPGAAVASRRTVRVGGAVGTREAVGMTPGMTVRRAAPDTLGGLTAEERLLRDTAREFAQREVAPTAIERDEQERFDRSIFARMGDLGLTGAPLPESIGGGGFSYLGWALVMEELGAADMATAVTLSVHLLSQFPVLNHGTEEQAARWLAPMIAGEALGAFCLTEQSG